ncbi:3-deoxy-8-phosphooctulonate synthase [candidate division KSB1 bacterium]|nr:MAG: 3-deoxy-8-phosphooctulonate synthase [candidate division KSB1 bacterium]
MTIVEVADIKIGEGNPLILIAGPCVIESEQLALDTAGQIQEICQRLGMPFIFKSSFTKDNRSSVEYFQGPGLEEGLRILQKVKDTYGIPVLSDIHNPFQAEPAADVLDVIQIPAYLSMQTSLVVAAGKTGRTVNVKKGQFLHPLDMEKVVKKLESTGNRRILITERGSNFGYHNLVVDMRALPMMRQIGYPVVFDVTHALRIYGVPSSSPAGGTPWLVPYLGRAGVAAGCDAVFIETHPDCQNALCDASSMWPLQKLEELLQQLIEIDRTVKKWL